MYGRTGRLGSEVDQGKGTGKGDTIFGGGKASTEFTKTYDFEDAPSQYDERTDKIFDMGSAKLTK